jgi:excisionase family DNA binding protein
MSYEFDLLTTAQVAEILGVKVDTIEKWRYQNRGPKFIRVGGLVRYRPSALEEYLQAQTVETDPVAA